jgi:hypothetical protein
MARFPRDAPKRSFLPQRASLATAQTNPTPLSMDCCRGSSQWHLRGRLALGDEQL